ncbi:MAG: glycerophosphodiester phosphodiesterase [Arcicella sp.]|jgi:glycerophosphoryl diester phosphodiesterase|nr:glycerophosphodiester phosphodiesterase [Arcicella sp.]
MKNLFLSLILLFMNSLVNAQNFDFEGHRGCRGLMPENTIPAFKKALDLGVTTLELDVCISKDHQVVVSHEPYMNMLFCSKPDGSPVTKADEQRLNLYQMNYDEIKRYDSGIRGNILFPEQQKMATYKPLLKDMIAECEAYIKANKLKPVKYNIEIKSEEKEYGISQPQTVKEFSDLVYKEIINQIPPERIILQSFDFNVLKYWKLQIDTKKYKRVILSALVENEMVDPSLEKLGFNPDIFSPYYKNLIQRRVEMCHAKGIKVVPWTVNNVEDMEKMIAIGVDGIISDYPDRFKKISKK